ncbi:MAG: ABC transporter permease subunit [Spirochaetia bacterium]|nr:ABC transporter permease subunit [Spirochaetia bacterium]
MLAYILRRLLYAVPIILGVNIITFLLFFVVNPPQDQARKALGGKNVTPAQIASYLHERGYDLPRFYNSKEETPSGKLTETIFYQKFVRLLTFDFGKSDADGRNIASEVSRRILPSLAVTVPSLLLGLFLDLMLAMMVAYYRGTKIDVSAAFIAVALMSISTLFYIIGLQFLFGKVMHLIPISGWAEGIDIWRFASGAVLISVIAGIGGSVRFYRTVFIEELSKDYIRTARAKGLSESRVLFVHGLRNALIPVITSVVSHIPFLILGSLLLESFFSIPGLGNYTVDALDNKDFAVVRSMVFFGSILTIAGLILTDLCYAFVDPRITLAGKGRGHGRLTTVYLAVIGFVLLIAAFGHATDPFRNGFQEAALAVKSVNPFEWNKTAVIWVGNILAGAFLLALLITLFRLSRSRMGTEVFKKIRANRLAFVSLIILSLFLSVAFLDSLSWRDATLGADGKAVKNPKTGEVELQIEAATLLDRAWLAVWSLQEKSPLKRTSETWEKTYSQPFAQTLFVKTVDPTTGKREHQKLKFPGRHLLGTDKAGADTLYRCLKGIRTGVIIGLLTTLLALPFAFFFGVMAGYFGGWVDDLVQYVYTTLSAIPGVLLIMSFILIFGQGLFQVCLILGLTGWIELCRLLRGETLKLREIPYVQASRALGAGHLRIMLRQLLPNLSHLILINLVLAFSGLVLAEATLSYLGIGVGPETGSWGNMINDARMELSRDPMVWWPIAGSFTLMFLLVLPANLFADAVRDALDPRQARKG